VEARGGEEPEDKTEERIGFLFQVRPSLLGQVEG
jgi:hypothetical protein